MKGAAARQEDGERPPRPGRLERAALAAAGLFLLVPAALMPPRTFGDSGEYFLTAESLLNHASPELRGTDLSQMLGRMARQPVGGGFRTMSAYRRGRGGALYAQHFWAYPALTMPVRVALRAVGAHEYKAFQLTNALLLLAAIWLCFERTPYAARWRVLAGALLLTGPLAWFVMLPHPEVYSAALVVAALCWWRTGSPVLATLAAALASLQNPPLILLVAFLGTRAVVSAPEGRLGQAARATLAVLPAAAPYLFNVWAFGTPSLIAEENIHLELIRPARALELIYDLNIGLVRCAPLTVALAVAASASAVAAARARGFVVAAWALVVAMAHVCSGMADWNHGTSGPSRYTVWLFPLIVWIICEGWSRLRSLLPAVAAGAAVAAQVAVFVARGGFRAPEDHLYHSWPARLVLRHWPSLYAPTHEIFAERAGRDAWSPEDDRERPVVYAVDGRCRKALAQKRHAQSLLDLCGSEPPAFTRFQESIRERDRGRGEWTYVNY